jgi:hypothetical protein
VNTTAPTCALCGRAVGDGEAARAVRDKFVCGDCRRLVLATEPAPVLPYADRAIRRRRWLWPAVAAAALALAVAASLLFTAQRVAIARARDAQMRALAAEAQARAVAEAQARLAAQAVRATPATQPAE